jgi:hypothetical protein
MSKQVTELLRNHSVGNIFRKVMYMKTKDFGTNSLIKGILLACLVISFCAAPVAAAIFTKRSELDHGTYLHSPTSIEIPVDTTLVRT